jgi:hypothetical protein
VAAIALIKAGNRTHSATEEAARTQLGFLRLAKGGQLSLDSDCVFTELDHQRFCMPCPTLVPGTLGALRQAFVDPILGLHAASKASNGAVFTKTTLDQPLGPDATAKKTAATPRANAGANPADAPPPPERQYGVTRHRFMFPDIDLHAAPRAVKMTGV